MSENNEMLSAYLYEANSILEQLDELLITAEKSSDMNEETINTIFRLMHTLKGSSSMMEFDSISKVSHKMEDLFASIREKGMCNLDPTNLFDILFKSGDFLKQEIGKVENAQPLSNNIGYLVDEISLLLKKFTDTENNIDADAKNSHIYQETTQNLSLPSMRVFFEQDSQLENIRAFMLVNAVKAECSEISTVPESPETVEAQLIAENGLLIYFPSSDDLERCRKSIESSIYVIKSEIIEASKNAQYEEKISNSGSEESAKVASPAAQASNITQFISVNQSKLDKLIDLLGEIVISESIFESVAANGNSDSDKFNKASRNLKKLTSELQDSIMSIRMVPVSTTFNKMNRIVRDMDKKLGKKAELVIVGGDTEVDKTVADSISDPLMHIVRNCMDHGIELPEERKAANKPETGKVTITAQSTSDEIIITVSDDGKGYDNNKILEKAKSKGLLTKPSNQYSENEIHALLLLPGFSTKEQVSEYSGRGVGMDVVLNNVEKIGGTVTLAGKKGLGTTVTIKIPLTLSILDGMGLTVGKSVFTIPIYNIKQSFRPKSTDIVIDSENNEMINIRNKCYPIVRLHKIYNIPTEITDFTNGIIIFVSQHDSEYCIFADSLIGEQQVVVKSLPKYLKNQGIRKQGIVKCALLGNGNISLVLDIPTLYNKSIGNI